MCSTIGIRLKQGLQTTVRGPNTARKDILSGSRRHFVNNEKIIYNIYKKIIDLVDCRI